MPEYKQPPPGTPDSHRTPGEEERDNDALRPNDPQDRPDDDVKHVEKNLDNLHDKARPL
ncbi:MULTISPECIES: hypothetical protein [Pseudomonas]|uniref:hypothetical protein n=1 Tax=Pseudomonas TaxID=286 RepID=UPI0002A7A7B8|nr:MULTISPECIES: hypothetical protein [Pseudomonas]ELQ18382.1 hypothetical protein A986_05426 [Pseudomonas fluorescens BRIP34879]AGE26338.1 hypothetical protein H045_11365 [Pseudomonas poae RE*1-1-14]MBC3196602.1 hypothetical protein [Pseudomonas poae]NMZ49599.1 hypothetical protein [Pseudomonas poae]CRM42161.1 hypothetical protein [Pseudomonas sp. 25 E 4]